MHTLTNAYKRKLSSGLVASLLVLSALSIVPLLIAPVHAANEPFITTMSYPYATVGGVAVTRGVDLTNPLGNNGITEINVNIPLAAATTVTSSGETGLGGGGTCSIAGTGPWTIECLGATAGETILPAGAAAIVIPGFNTEAAQTVSGTADHYSFTVTVYYTDGSSQSAVDTFTEGTLAITNVTPSLTSFIAGGSITYTMAIAADAGVKLSWFSNPSTAGVAGDGFTASFGTPSFTTSSSTSFTSSFTATESSATSCADADNGAIDTSIPCGYFAWVDAGVACTCDTGGMLLPEYDGTNVPVADAATNTADAVAMAVAVSPAAPTQVTVGVPAYDVPGNSPDYVSNGGTAEALTVSLADSYGNAIVTAGITGTVTLTALKGTITNPMGTVTCNGVACMNSVHPTYAPLIPAPTCTSNCLLPYGTYDLVTASLVVTAPANIAGTYAGSSKELSMGYDTTVALPDTDWTVYHPSVAAVTAATGNVGGSNVVAGTLVQLSLTLDDNGWGIEANVPVNFSLTAVTTSYTGTFSNGLSWIVVKTNSNGIAAANFTADTLAGDEATANGIVSEPTTASPTNTAAATATGGFTTIAAAGTKLIINTYFDTALTTLDTYAPPSGNLYIDVELQDAYGNNVPWNSAFALQITLAYSAGGLSATTVYITSGEADTFHSGYQVQFTAPETLGTVTLTATTTQPTISEGTATVNVVSIDPTVTLTPPVTTTLSSNTATVNATGVPSLAAAVGTVVTSFMYSLNGAANQTVGITATNSTGASFSSFPVTFANGTNTLKIYATDSNDNTGVGTFTFTVSHVPIIVTFTSTGAVSATEDGFTGASVTFTNPGGASSDNVYFVWYNSANQIVNVGAQLNVAFAAGGSETFFSTISTPGTYTVECFVQSTSGVALSTSYSVTVTIG